jgi:hypothetical protein
MPTILRRYADEPIPLIAELSQGDEIILQAGRMTFSAPPNTGLAPSEATASRLHLDNAATAVRDAIASLRSAPPVSREQPPQRVHLGPIVDQDIGIVRITGHESLMMSFSWIEGRVRLNLGCDRPVKDMRRS